MGVDPFLNKFVAEAEDTGEAVVRACADDIGAALRNISGLALLKPTFDDAREYAGTEASQVCLGSHGHAK